jgi:NAD(P)-dependent dehydrogenase (short-subunit alcohol dehydrogenase family)
MPTVLVTGANRGIGLGFSEVFVADGWRVIAAARDPSNATDLKALAAAHPGKIEIVRLDLADFASIEALGAQLAETPIDVLLGNAAKTDNPAATIGDTNYAAWMEAFRVNCMAQMKLAETFVTHVARSAHKKMFFVSSRIGANPPPGMILFRSSKSALNQVVLQLAFMLKDRGIAVACAHPGFVQTPSTANMGVFTARESAAHLKKIIDRLDLAGSGQFYEPDGSTLPIVTRQMNPAAFGSKPVDAWAEQQKVWDREGRNK